ncbi:MAG TPA: hypothetical protein GXX35_04550 [Thermoanaerobacterales bacterium]|nr:hypothetical protein [Thermoanaerobacterales bacterium]
MFQYHLLYGWLLNCDGKGDASFTIEETPVTRPTAFSFNSRNKDAEVKTVDLNGIEATLIYFKKNGTRQLM